MNHPLALHQLHLHQRLCYLLFREIDSPFKGSLQWLRPGLVEAVVGFEQPMAQLVLLSPLQCWLKLVLSQLLPAHFYFLQEEVPLSPGRG